MFVGHSAIALAAKTKAPKLSLGWLFAATFLLDLIWPVFLLLGIERVRIEPGTTAFNPFVFESYPWSHSLLASSVWALLFAGIARWRGIAKRDALLLGAVVVSHWLLDVASHAPDMPLWPGPSPLLGLELWRSVPATLMVEGALYVAGIALYLRATRAKDRIGSIGLWALLMLCTVAWASGPWSAPPPSVEFLGWFGIGAWLLVAWAGWADAHRAPA